MAKEGSSDYKKVRKRWLFKEPLTEWFFVEPKMVLLWHCCEEPFEAPLFLRVCLLTATLVYAQVSINKDQVILNSGVVHF